jgi:hypothetical protein
MAFIQRSFLCAAVALQAGCFSTAPSRPQPYPIPDPSVFASLNCEELAYTRDGHQQLLQNLASDHPNDSQLLAPMHQANIQGLSNALAQRNCPVSGQTNAPPPAPVSSSESYCFAYYTNRDLLEPTNTTTGMISKTWETGAKSGGPARVALAEFQTFLISRVNSEQLGPTSCNTYAQTQSCSAMKVDSGTFSHGARSAMVLCDSSRESVEKGRAIMQNTTPLVQMIDWLPVQANAIAAHSSSVTPSSVVVPSSVAAPITPALVSPSLGTVPPTLKSPATPTAPGQLGVYASPVTPTVVKSFGLPGTNGVLVLGPVPGSNAERDGMLAGDIILSIDGKPVNTPAELTAISSRMQPGSQVPLRVWRYRAAIDMSVEISKAGGQ